MIDCDKLIERKDLRKNLCTGRCKERKDRKERKTGV